MWRGKKYYIARTERESKRRFAKSRNTRRNERNTTTTTGGRICVNNCVFSFIASLLFFFLFYFFFFCQLSSFVFYEHFLIFAKIGVHRITNPWFFFFFFERTLRSTLISKVGTTCLGLKNIMYSLCKYCYDQLCSFQFRLLPSRSLAFSAPIVVFLPFFS